MWLKVGSFCLLPFVLNILTFLTDVQAVVPNQVTITGNYGETYFLEGAAVHDEFNQILEPILKDRITKAARFILDFSINKGDDFVISTLNMDQYLFLLLLNALSENDIMMTDILLTVMNTYYSIHMDVPNKWIETHFNIPPRKLYNAFKFITVQTSFGISIPKSFIKKLIHLNETNKVFSNACVEDDLELVRWLVDAGYNLDTVGPEATKILWQNGHFNVTKLLMSKGSLNNKQKTSKIINATNGNNDTLLHFSVETGDVDATLQLLKANADVNAKDNNDQTPLHKAVQSGSVILFNTLLYHGADLGNQLSKDSFLHIAVEQGNTMLVKKLVELGANIDSIATQDYPPIYIAISRNDTTMIEVLIERGANVNIKLGNGETLLHRAVAEKNLKAVRVLLRSGSPTETKNDKGYTPLLLAAAMNEAEIIKALISNGANVNMKTPSGDTPVHLAASEGNLEALIELVSLGAAINIKNTNGDTPLYKALDRNEVAAANILASKLISLSCNKDEFGNTFLHNAAFDGKPHAVKLFTNYGVIIDVKNLNHETPFYKAAQIGHIEIMKMLLSHGANMYTVNVDGWPLLHMAAISDDKLAATSLLDVGFEVNRKGKWEYTALHLAVQRSSLPLVEALLEYGANKNAKDHHSKTPLYEATWYDKGNTVKLLLHEGADPNIADISGWTPLHIAARFNYIAVAKLLIYSRCDIDAANNDNKTPLYEAVWYKNPDIVKLLIENGASPNITTKDGETPMLLAKKHLAIAGYPYIYALLTKDVSSIYHEQRISWENGVKKAFQMMGEKKVLDLSRRRELVQDRSTMNNMTLK